MDVSTHELTEGANLHLTIPSDPNEYPKATITIFVGIGSDPTQPPKMGSMVYALPNHVTKSQLSTRLFQQEESIDCCERLAKSIVLKTNRPVICSTGLSVGAVTIREIVNIICEKMSI